MTLQEIQQRINQIRSQIPLIRSRVQQLAQSRGKSVVNPPSPPKPVAPVFSSVSSSATKYKVPKRNVVPELNTKTSIVDYLKSMGKPSDFGSRAQLAKQYNIPNYTGTAEQNIKLLNVLKGLRTKNIEKTTTGGEATIGKTVTGKTQTGETNIGKSQEEGEKSLATLTGGGSNVKDVVQSYINKYLGKIDYSDLADQAKKIAEETYQPIENKLKDIITNIKKAYKSAQDDLLENQKRELEELKGAYAVRGLLNSGVYQQALQELRKKHVQELNDLTQREAQDITNISYEVASKKPTAINNILSMLNSELQNQRMRASILLGNLLTNELTEEREKRKEKQVKTTTTITDDKGNKYLVLLDANGNEIKRIYIGKSEPQALFEDTSTGKQYDLGTVEGIKNFINDYPKYKDWQKMKDLLTLKTGLNKGEIEALLRSAGLKENQGKYDLSFWRVAAKEAIDRGIKSEDEFIYAMKKSFKDLTPQDIKIAKAAFGAELAKRNVHSPLWYLFHPRAK